MSSALPSCTKYSVNFAEELSLCTEVLCFKVAIWSCRSLVCHGHIRPSFADRTLCFLFLLFFVLFPHPSVKVHLRFPFLSLTGRQCMRASRQWICRVELSGAAESTDALHCFIMNEYTFRGSVCVSKWTIERVWMVNAMVCDAKIKYTLHKTPDIWRIL